MQRPRTYRLLRFVLLLSSLLISLYLLSLFFAPLRYLVLGVVRCLRVAYAVAGCILDYKLLFRRTWQEDTEAGRRQRHEDYENTHYSAARRILAVLRRNGGIYVKLGQHLSSVQLIPTPWAETMKPLQDQCHPTPYGDMDALFRRDMGASIDELFSEFDRKAIGVASLAQVHHARDRKTGREVAVKIMHPDLEEYSEVDMHTAVLMLKVVKWVFPTFEFTWLGEEMQENLPKEMDFRHEASMAERCRQDFAHMRHTTLFIPQVLWAKKRILVMEYIHGARVDDLEYLAEHKIDRNRVSQEIAAIFSRMLYLHGFFHADPHGGNLLIRPASPGSRSSYNFEVVLLDHGLYFDLPYDLRTNYARLWLSLMKTTTPTVAADRRKYARLVGNIDDTQYAIFESAITGRAGLDGTWDDPSASQFDPENPNGKRAGSLLDVGKVDRAEMKRIRDAVVEGGLVTDIFQILRTVPRRLLMVLKVNDLTRSLDHSLHTTHPPTRIWLIVARYCGLAVWEDERKRLREERWREGWSLGWMGRWLGAWLEHQRWTTGLCVAEFSMDVYAGLSKLRLWLRGLRHGLRGAYREAAGLDVA